MEFVIFFGHIIMMILSGIYNFLFVDIPAIFKKKTSVSTLDNDLAYVEEHAKIVDQIFRINNTTKLIRARHNMMQFMSKWDMILGKERLWLQDKADIKNLYQGKDKEMASCTTERYFSEN